MQLNYEENSQEKKMCPRQPVSNCPPVVCLRPQRMLSNSEDECTHTKEELDRLQTEQQALISKHTDVAAELKEVAQKLTEAEKMHADEVRGYFEIGSICQRLEFILVNVFTHTA